MRALVLSRPVLWSLLLIPQRQTILMSAPDYFGVDYVINTWMENQVGKADQALAARQWNNLRDALAGHVELAFIKPEPGIPDLVFTANAGFVLGGKAIVSRFRSVERQAEEPFNRAWFEGRGFALPGWPQHIAFEGAGDALLDRGQKLVWCGHGFRSDAAAPAQVEKILGRKAVPLKLVDPHFYHLDTCFCPLEGGWLIYYPPAFDRDSQERILALTPAEKRIAVADEDAAGFACNAVDLGGHVFLNHATDALQTRLRQAGFKPVVTPLSEFLKAGGGAKCLTLKLVEA
jgi:N-dimethylarginine dimethylaminohydrolase